jgi:transcriptional regulator with XRE-family HTH domain
MKQTYISEHRRKSKLSIRGLATKAGLDSGALTRLEHGETRTPRPETLRALAEALEVPIADMYAAAGHVTPYDLPSLVPYLRTRYRHLSDAAIRDASAYLDQLIKEHRLESDGPSAHEDEITTPDAE